MPENDFHASFIKAAEDALVKFIGSQDWLKLEWNEKFLVGNGIFRQVYESIDIDRVKARLCERIEDKVVDTIIASMATEIGTDTKRIMSNQELREDLRSVLRDRIRSCVKETHDV